MISKVLILFVLALLMSCARTPLFDDSQVAFSVTPKLVIADADRNREKIVLWGGTVLDVRNLKASTQIEVLAYPLNSSHRPKMNAKPLGRFIIVQQGYLEPASYAQGRQITVLGSVGANQTGIVGESSYVYPQIDAQQLHLWSVKKEQPRSSFRFGLGIRL